MKGRKPNISALNEALDKTSTITLPGGVLSISLEAEVLSLLAL
jgi:hypothetical protein